MLQTQVNYWTLQENVRSHKENEAILQAQNRETQRHQLETESIQRYEAEEVARHNAASESLGFNTLNETIKHNREQEKLGWASNTLQKKSLKETIRADKARESIQKKNLIEERRHNKQQEKLIPETVRHNKATESNTLKQIQLGFQELAESVRTHKANEALGSQRNVTEQLLGWSNVNIDREKLGWERTKTKEYEYPVNYQNAQTNEYNAKSKRADTVFKGIESVTNSARNINDMIRGWITLGG